MQKFEEIAVDSAQYRVTQRSTARNLTPRSIKLRRVKLRALLYCAESSSGQYHTARSFSLQFHLLTPRSMILRGVRFWRNFFDFALYDTAQSQSITVHFYTLHIRFVLHIVSFDSDEIETSIFFIVKHT